MEYVIPVGKLPYEKNHIRIGVSDRISLQTCKPTNQPEIYVQSGEENTVYYSSMILGNHSLDYFVVN